MIMQIWKTIMESNAFNFVLMIAFFAWLFKKIDIKKAITAVKDSVIQALNNADNEKKIAGEELSKAKGLVKNLDSEIKETLTAAENNAKDLVSKIEDSTRQRVETIENNIERVISGEEKTINAKLTSLCSKNSIDIAKEKLLNKLAQNPELHQKYLDKSLEDLDKVEL